MENWRESWRINEGFLFIYLFIYYIFLASVWIITYTPGTS